MTVLDYINNLNKLKQVSLSRWDNLGFENDIINEAYNWLLDNLNIQRGTPQADEELTRAMDSFLTSVVNIIADNKEYQGKISSFLSDLDTIYKNQKRFYATSHNFNIETAGVKEAQKTVVNEIVNQYTENGLNPNFAAPLRDNVYRNILAGANMKEVKQVLNNYILGGQDQSGKLGSYLTQTAQQAVDSYTGMINQKLQQEFTFTGYIISGSIIETSSRQCIYAIETSTKGYLPFSDWDIVLEIAATNKQAPLIPGTTIKNLPLNKLHWGCRHDFTPVVMDKVIKPKDKEKAQLEAIKKAEAKKQDSLSMHQDSEGNFTPERQQLHDAIVNDFVSEGTSKKGIVYSLGGAPANGKSTLVESGIIKYPKHIVNVNADLIKERLPEYRTMVENKVATGAAFAHEESSYLSKEIIRSAIKEKKDMLIDGVGDGSFDKVHTKIQEYKKQGYYTRADYVSLDTSTSLKLAEARGNKTGRFVPESYILEMNREISNLVPELLSNNTFNELNLWDTNTQGKPRLILTQKDGVLNILDQELYNNFLNKGK